MREDNTIYKCLIKFSFTSIGQDNSKLQKHTSKLLILFVSVDLSCLVLYLKDIFIENIYIVLYLYYIIN